MGTKKFLKNPTTIIHFSFSHLILLHSPSSSAWTPWLVISANYSLHRTYQVNPSFLLTCVVFLIFTLSYKIVLKKWNPVSWYQCKLMLSSSSRYFTMLLFFKENYLWTFTNCAPKSSSLPSNTQPCHEPSPLTKWPILPLYYDDP